MAQDRVINQFHWADYVVFILVLLMSGAIGFFFAFAKKYKNKDSKDLLVGGRQMNAVPVGLSLLASFLSAPFMMGAPAEIYLFGAMYSILNLGSILTVPVMAHLIIPMFRRLDIISGYEYLDLRFNGVVCMMASITFIIWMVLYLANILYAPALSFAKVTGLTDYVTMIVVGLVCTIYTSIGGIKAVVWTDVLQICIMMAGTLLLCVKGVVDAGGINEVINTASRGGRLDWTNTNISLHERHSWPAVLIGSFVNLLGLRGSNQAAIQRYLSIKSTRQAQAAMYFSEVILIIFSFLVYSLGIIMYTYYLHCDPLTSKLVSAGDQIVPLFMMDIVGHLHGLPGLYTAAIFSATLSTVSSGLNSLAAVFLSNIIKPLHKSRTGMNVSEKTATVLSKVLVIILGVCIIAISYTIRYMGKTLLTITLTVFGIAGGPLLGVFFLGFFFPRANSWGAGVGLLTGLTLTLWIAVGSILHPNRPQLLVLLTDQCPSTNDTVYTTEAYTTATFSDVEFSTTSEQPFQEHSSALLDLYHISYMWYSVISFLSCFLVGLIVSFCTGCGHTPPASTLIYPYKRKCSCCYDVCCKHCCAESDSELQEKEAYNKERSFTNKAYIDSELDAS